MQYPSPLCIIIYDFAVSIDLLLCYIPYPVILKVNDVDSLSDALCKFFLPETFNGLLFLLQCLCFYCCHFLYIFNPEPDRCVL